MPAQIKGGLPDRILHSVQMDKHGVISAVIKVQRKLTEINFLEALRDAPAIGLPLVSVQYAIAHGVASIDYAYEGIDPANDPNPERQTTFELDLSMSDDPAKSHPNWENLKALYGWDEEKEHFQEFLPEDAAGGGSTGFSRAKKRKNGKSDLAGTDSYLNAGAIFRKSYAAREIPGNILRGIGTVVDRPPGIEQFRLPAAARRRNWLKLAPKIRKRGNAVEITEEYMLSGPNGWNEDIYGASQLES